MERESARNKILIVQYNGQNAEMQLLTHKLLPPTMDFTKSKFFILGNKL